MNSNLSLNTKYVDDIIFKTYLSRLGEMKIAESRLNDLNQEQFSKSALFKINKMVYETDEYATEKFISVITAMTYADCSICLIVDGKGHSTDFYLGVYCNDKKRELRNISDTFISAINGQFPGTQIKDISTIGIEEKNSEKDILLERIKDGSFISLYSGVPTLKDKKSKYTNKTFLQGIEKFANAMKGKTYTAVILASNANSEIEQQREAYESLYSKLSIGASMQRSYTLSSSIAESQSETTGSSITETINESHNITIGENVTKNNGESHGNIWAKLSALPLVGVIPGLFAKQTNSGSSFGSNTAVNDGKSKGISKADTNSKTSGTTETKSSSDNVSVKIQDKHIQELLKRIDKQLERISTFESNGLWQSCAYFVSYNQDRSVSETAATIFRSIMQGDESGVEKSSVNTWYDSDKVKKITNYISHLQHPLFQYDDNTELNPTSLISSSELAIMMGLPRKSVPGFSVIEHASLGKEVVKTSLLDSDTTSANLIIGNIFDQGEEQKSNSVSLSIESLSGHTFVTGATGSGKSQTIYKLIDGLTKKGKQFLIIEPAKGEYKKIFGNMENVNILGTNPLISKMLHINPFKFQNGKYGIHVLEHIDRLIEIFNACWPMYAAMPAILKESILEAYKKIGWDLFNSTNKYSNDLYPTFYDVLTELKTILNNSEFHDDAKENYKGALETRIKSLTNGIVGEIFSFNENGDEVLFDQNTIIDISRVGSQETKSLIMGILIMRLNEYRMSRGDEPNSNLKHITVLEEAHNILKNSAANQNIEGGNTEAKAVEMISNSIAEMRTYGEGFIIVDQSPNAIDISAMRNTNTKIIMRLPETEDRRAAGKAAGLKDNQIDEIAKLPTGVAVVYQNDWEEPVLCKIHESGLKPNKITKEEHEEQNNDNQKLTAELLKFFLQGRINSKNDFDLDYIKKEIVSVKIPSLIKIMFFDSISEYEKCNEISLWSDNNYVLLSSVISQLFDFRIEAQQWILQYSDPQKLEKSIISFIQRINPLIPQNLHIVIVQSILRYLSLASDDCEKIYDNWFINKRNELLTNKTN